MDEFVQKFGFFGSSTILICGFNIIVILFDLIFVKTREDFIFDRIRVIMLFVTLITQIMGMWLALASYDNSESKDYDDDL
jgi:multisubunit Na+/H+ antiporter MnhG subunit